MIFSFLKFLNLSFKNHHRKRTLKTCEKSFFKSFIIASLLHLQLCHRPRPIIVKVYFKARRLNYRPNYSIYNISDSLCQGPSIKYVTQFLANFDPLPLSHSVTHPETPKKVR